MGTFPAWEWAEPTLTALLFKVTVLLGAGWLAHWGMKSMNPRWRVLLWRSVICGIVAIPLLSYVTPSVPIKVSQLPPIGLTELPYFNPQTTVEAPTEPAHLESNPVQSNATYSTVPAYPAEKQYETSAPSWNATRLLFLLWGIVAVGCAIGFLPSLIGMNRIKKSARRVPDSMQAVFDRVRLDFQCWRKVHLLCSPHLATPILYGFLSSTVFVPEFMTKSGYKKEWEAVFAHELAHHRGKDAGWEVVIRLLQITLWFHPLIWRIRDAHSAACEQVCDATAARYVGDFESYSKTLARAALDLHQIRSSCGGIAMVRQAKIHNRLEALKQKIIDLPFTKTRLTLFGCIVCFFFIGLTALNIVEELGAAESGNGESGTDIQSNSGLTQPDQPKTMSLRKLPEGFTPDVLKFQSSGKNYAAKVDWDTGNLVLENIHNGECKNLTNNGSWNDPVFHAEECAISPSEETIAYSWYDGKNQKYEIRLIQVNGTNDHLIGEKFDCYKNIAWINDQKLFIEAKTKEKSDCFLLSITDGTKEFLFSKEFLRTCLLSPDRKFVAFDTSQNQDWLSPKDIFVYSMDDKKEQCIVNYPADDRLLGWSSEGKWLLYISDRLGFISLWGVQLDSHKHQSDHVLLYQFSEKVYMDAVFLSQENTLYFREHFGRAESYITSMDFATGEFLDTPMPASHGIKAPSIIGGAWSNDGKLVAFTSTHNGALTKLEIYSPELKATRSISTNFQHVAAIAWSQDDKYILCNARYTWNDPDRALYQLNVDSGEFKLLKDNTSKIIGYSKDEEHFYYLTKSDDAGTRSIVKRHFETGQEETIYSGTITCPPHRAQSYDKNWIACYDEKENCIRLVSLESGDTRTVFKHDTQNTASGFLSWTPDSQSIFYMLPEEKVNPPSTVLWKIPIDSGEPKEIRHYPGNIIIFTQNNGNQVIVGYSHTEYIYWAMEDFLPLEISQGN